jgi:hypothetical protein
LATTPTATQKLGDVHETLIRVPAKAGLGLGTIDHEMPLKTSARVTPVVSPEDSPTATQKFGEVHEMLPSTVDKPEMLGLEPMVHVVVEAAVAADVPRKLTPSPDPIRSADAPSTSDARWKPSLTTFLRVSPACALRVAVCMRTVVSPTMPPRISRDSSNLRPSVHVLDTVGTKNLENIAEAGPSLTRPTRRQHYTMGPLTEGRCRAHNRRDRDDNSHLRQHSL